MSDSKLSINWFPGHMQKSFRELESSLKIIDAVICVLDARAPYSCINRSLENIISGKEIIYVLNKSDMANPEINKEWKKFFEGKGKICEIIDATKSSCKNVIFKAINKATNTKQEKQKSRGVLGKIRIAIVGVPNTGKSTLLNTLGGAYLSKTGNLAGITRSSSWIKIKNGIELMDNAGTLAPKISDPKVAKNLAFIGSINDNVLSICELAEELVKKLILIAPQQLENRYKLNCEKNASQILTEIGKIRGYVVKGGEVDLERTSSAIIDDFRKGRIGKISLESPKDYTTNER